MATNEQIRERLARRVPPGWDGVTVGDGWLPIVDRLDQRLAAINAGYQLFQCKEKFGGLRYYTNNDGVTEVADLIGSAEKEAARTCEDCGRRGTLVSIRGWWRTVCEEDKAR